jgi:prenyltransferase beta subunit
MLQVARLSPKLLGESRHLVESFLRSQINPDGGFRNRAGESDLYYTVFGLESLVALQAEPPVDDIARFLLQFGNGEGLDFVHLACLGRCWAGLKRAPQWDILSRIEGGYETAYEAFLTMGLYQDLGVAMPDPDRMLASLQTLRAEDGGFSNFPGAASGITPATAAVVTLMRQLHRDPDPALADWLLARCLPSGGFFAMPGAPVPDLLSTATALHALAGMQVPLNGLREPCLDFVDSLWTNRGGFYGHWSDDAIDTEYTYYALLSLGHLAV